MLRPKKTKYKKSRKGRLKKNLEQKEFKKVLEAARSCPVNVIHIYDLETNKKII